MPRNIQRVSISDLPIHALRRAICNSRYLRRRLYHEYPDYRAKICDKPDAYQNDRRVFLYKPWNFDLFQPLPNNPKFLFQRLVLQWPVHWNDPVPGAWCRVPVKPAQPAASAEPAASPKPAFASHAAAAESRAPPAPHAAAAEPAHAAAAHPSTSEALAESKHHRLWHVQLDEYSRLSNPYVPWHDIDG
jgi:hypothetical protein